MSEIPFCYTFLGLRQLREYKFKHSFQDTLNSLCSCRKEAGATCFLLPCPKYQ